MEKMDGIILINKNKNCTSHDIVSKVRKALNIKKVGHTGTLDPNATGVLPLLIGDATKLSKYLINHDKEYEVVLKLGIKTDTADSEGKVIEERQVGKLDENLIVTVLKEFLGKQKQTPPMYSAIKVNGKKLYEYARKGESVKIEPREIEIYNIELLNVEGDEISFKVNCSKGTYIRSLCEDIAQKLGTVGYMKELNRTKVGEFCIKDAIDVEKVSNLEKTREKLISIEQFFKDKPTIEMDEKELEKFLNGVKLPYKNYKNGVYNIYKKNGQYIGIGYIDKNMLKRDIILTHDLYNYSIK